jgi:hypothetical protein
MLMKRHIKMEKPPVQFKLTDQQRDGEGTPLKPCDYTTFRQVEGSKILYSVP